MRDLGSSRLGLGYGLQAQLAVLINASSLHLLSQVDVALAISEVDARPAGGCRGSRDRGGDCSGRKSWPRQVQDQKRPI
jgi:hypothetical protein